jgi:hypothetical protein
MQGSTIEAMADAVEQSAVMCYAVSQSCERRPSISCHRNIREAQRLPLSLR